VTLHVSYRMMDSWRTSSVPDLPDLSLIGRSVRPFKYQSMLSLALAKQGAFNMSGQLRSKTGESLSKEATS
jgi:hypothetical protein